jgi:hypothetical protein
VERRNGLSQLASRTAQTLAASAELKASGGGVVTSGAATSPLQMLRLVVKKYGVVALLLALLGYGYTQFRRRKTEQLLLHYEADKTQRMRRNHSRVEALLAVVKDQQVQYNQAAGLLTVRVANYLAAQQAATNQAAASKASTSATQFSRGLELQALQSELMELKSAVVDTYFQPRVVEKVVEVTKEIPIVLRPIEANAADRLSQATAVDIATEGSQAAAVAKKQRHTKKTVRRQVTQEHGNVRDQTTMSSEEITELFERCQVDEQLSTAGSYRLLFAAE